MIHLVCSSLQKLPVSDEAVMQPRHCLYSNIYVSVKISVHNSVSSSCVLSLPHRPPRSISPIVPGLRGVGGHSKKASNTVQSVFYWTEELLAWCDGVRALLPPETTTEELGSFEQNRWKVSPLKWSRRGVSHECGIQDETGLGKEKW